MVYILAYDDIAIVIGRGKKNRAKVMFDNEHHHTTHFKSLLVRLYHIYGDDKFNRFIIKCNNKEESQRIEKDLHKRLGGNTSDLPNKIRKCLFENITPGSYVELFLRLALLSSYDGLSDLRKWRKNNIIDTESWGIISGKLKIS